VSNGTSHRPASRRELFFAFQALSLQGFGGVIPLAQRVLVDHRQWLTRTEFLSLLSISQILPGPNIVNMALIYGDKLFGWRGAVAAAAGLLAAPLALVLVLAITVQQIAHMSWMGDALRGMGVVAAGLVLSTAFKLFTALRENRMGWQACALLMTLTVGAVAGLRWSLVWVLAILVPIGWYWAWRCWRPAESDGSSDVP
jgi:chromate transporter